VRTLSLATVTLTLFVLPEGVRAQGLLSNLIESARRTPNGIAVKHPSGSDAWIALEESESGLPKPAQGGIELKVGDDAQVSFAAQQSLVPQFGSADLAVGGLARSPFLGLRGFGMMAKQDGRKVDVASGFVLAREGERLAASEIAIETGWSSVLVQGGFQGDDDDGRDFTDGAFGGAAFESSLGGVGYSMRWHGSFDGSTGAISLKRGDAAIGLSRDFGAGILSPHPTVTARWKQDLPLGGLQFRLDSKPTEQKASTRVNWTLEW
jgi:hypothetical protein